VLFRLLDRRLEYLSTDKTITPDKFWNEYITEYVNEKPVKNFIMDCIVPRPRDLIFFINTSKNNAVGKGHSYISESDLEDAYVEYSNWVFQSLMVENGITINQLKEFLYHLVGTKSIVTYDEIRETMIKAGISTESKSEIQYFIDHLCTLSFIGREIRQDEFYFDYGYETDDKKVFLANKFNSQRFKIHNAFIPYMECEDYVR
ncbi:MAG TPA: hypothetical protein VEV62_07915, partial [Parafilimonas sp.]|nr:hypothetical protein [Parafilimonas sp.]